MSSPLKQSSRNSVFDNVYPGFIGKDEIAVSEILLDLPNLISDFEWRRQFPSSVCWGKKRKRSALDSPTSTTATTPPSPSCRQPEIERHVLKIIKTKNKKGETATAAAATSPSTPLSFSPSESDEHMYSKQSTKSNYKKKTKEELLEIIDGLNHNRELLIGEVDTMRSKHFKLSATNLELKAKKQEISFGQKTEKKPQLGMNGVYIEHYQYQMTKFAPQPNQFLMEYKAFYESQNYGQRTPPPPPPNGTSPYYGMRLVNLGPRGIPDLNVCAEESCVLGASSQPLDLMSKMMMDNSSSSSSRLRAADARKRRMMKIKEVKNQGRGQSQRHPGP